MNQPIANRGGAPVGLLAELGPVEAGAVRCLRLWCDGSQSQASVWSEFARKLGPAEGKRVLKNFETLCQLCVRHGRRPLMRHHIRCKCLGADESCFANFVGYASEGAREDALMMAATIVRADMADALVGLAEDFGAALRQMNPAHPLRLTEATPASHTIH